MKYFLAFLSLIFATITYAKPINLYDEPKADSKIVGTLDSQVGAITIFTPKDGGWIKVADPRDGKVGWIKSSEFGPSNFSYQVITSGDGGNSYRVYQYGGTEAVSPQKMDEEIKQMQLRQRAIQRNMQHMMQDMFADFYYPTPIFVPVIVVPEKSVSKPAPAPVKAKTETAQPTPSTAPATKK